MLEKKVSVKRAVSMTIVLLSIIVTVAVLCVYNNILLDATFCVVSISVMFFILLVFMTMKHRIINSQPDEYNSYGKCAIASILASVAFLSILITCPDFFSPLMVVAIIFTCAFPFPSALALSIFYISVYAITTDMNINIFCCYILFMLFGCMLCVLHKQSKAYEKIMLTICVFALNILIPFLFYYLAYSEIKADRFIYGLVSSGICTAVYLIIVPIFSRSIEKKTIDVYEDILVDGYSLVEDIKRYSLIEYEHCVRVANLCAKCAYAIDANPQLAKAAGFYYRLGKMLGEPEIDNAIRACNDHCFPDNLTNIIYEYRGIMRLPSSIESAIVYMVDSVVTKIELLDKDSMSSGWNQSMVIYQTVDEDSRAGKYDSTGLSLNQILKIRDVIKDEDVLA